MTILAQWERCGGGQCEAGEDDGEEKDAEEAVGSPRERTANKVIASAVGRWRGRMLGMTERVLLGGWGEVGENKTVATGGQRAVGFQWPRVNFAGESP